MDLVIVEKFTPHVCTEIEHLEKSVFQDTYRPGHFTKKITEHSEALGLLIYSDNQLVGYKIGYPYNKKVFYSWLGGVHKDFRNQGIARLLMEKQHELLKKRGFNMVKTKTRASYKPMLILNLQEGFSIVGTETNPRVYELILLLDKKLN